ncbi:hypothetical protein BTVI_07569 [Pitangus sulphuratus]|nr:hypothetical protein BTVI_07569 [Pitangus sulphuratus]
MEEILLGVVPRHMEDRERIQDNQHGFTKEVLLSFFIGLVLASSRSILEQDGTGSAERGGSFWQFLTEATPGVPPATKTGTWKPDTDWAMNRGWT